MEYIMDLNEIQNEVDRDLKIDDTELDLESIRTPQLHNKYLKHYTKYSLQLKKAKDEYKSLYKFKWEYYTGKSDPEVYSKTPFDLKILKGDLKLYTDSDEDLSKLRQRITYTKERVDYLRSVCKIVSDRNWAIKNSMDWLKFKEGIV